jgi:hypothetical protein
MYVDGRLVFTIAYNKSSSITWNDKAVAHAVSWALTQQFLIMNVHICPFVEQLV